MPSIHEELSQRFHEWEVRGRGWDLFSNPVRPEPPFRPFEGHYLANTPLADDGRQPSFLNSIVRNLFARKTEPTAEEFRELEPEPEEFEHVNVVEFRTSLPASLNITREACGEFLSNLSLCRCPLACEIVGTDKEITLQFACEEDDSPLLHQQLEAHFPEATFVSGKGSLERAWTGSAHDEPLIVEFGLAREFMFQLRTEKSDPFVGIVGALSKLRHGEVAVFQVLFESVRNNWQESIEFSLCHADGKAFFVNATDLAAAAKWKIMQRLYAAVVRIGILSESFERTLEIARALAGSLGVFANPLGNELLPLQNDDYDLDIHVADLLNRNSRRSGMILTSDELLGFVHLPSSSVRAPAFLRDGARTKAAPLSARTEEGVLLGTNAHAGSTVEVRLKAEERVRHMHVIGASGTGKSSLFFNLIKCDIESGQGIAVLDPHGDLIDRILTIIPEKRVGDVVLVDPSDEEHSIGFNILSAHSDLEKTLLASDLISVFQRLSASWGDQMGSVLQNAILAFLESESGGTLADMRRFLIEPAFRERFLKTVRDPDIVYYWKKGFTQLAGNKSIGSVITRLETFLAPKPIRYMVSQPENRLDFGHIMDSGKIFLAKLPQGKMGKENSFLLGSLFVSKFQQTAMSRQDRAVANRRDFWLYLDEFHNFMTPSMAEILSGARKYRLGLILAHQELRQLDRDREVGSAVLSNSFTRVIFRVGDSDARNLAEGLSFFEASDLQNLEIGQAICRIEKANGDFNLVVPFPDLPSTEEGEARKRTVIDASRSRYARPRAKVEAELHSKLDQTETRTPVPEPPSATKGREIEPPTSPKIQRVIPPQKLGTSNEYEQHAQTPVSTQPVFEPPATTRKPESPVERPMAYRPGEQGIGGARHKIIQKRIKDTAQASGFNAEIESPVPNSNEKFDVLLKRSDMTMACEISFTTTIDHEIGNISKCLRTGIPAIAIICVEQNRLGKIKGAVAGIFSASDAARVTYFTPAEFIAHLKTLAPAKEPAKRPQQHGGRVIKRSVSKVSAEERSLREAEYHRQIAEALRSKRK